MNIRDIAREAGVSVATVSRIINNIGNVNEETRLRVLEIIEKSNYIPNAHARSISKGRSRNIGLVIPDIANPFFPSIAKGVEHKISSENYSLILCDSDNDPDLQDKYLYMLQEQRVDGVILIPTERSQEITDFMDNNPMTTPIVFCDRVPRNCKFSSVQTDHVLGVRLATEHIMKLGHMKIAIITGVQDYENDDRYIEFVSVCNEYGVDSTDIRVGYGNFDHQSGYQQMSNILLDFNPTAVFCANDMMALGAIDAVLEKGLEVPKDISVIGYDNILFSKFAKPPLTTVHQPTYLLGVTAAEILLREINGIGQVCHELIEPKLVIRGSSAAVGGITV